MKDSTVTPLANYNFPGAFHIRIQALIRFPGLRNSGDPDPMNPLVLHTLHVASALALFTSLGAIFFGSGKKFGSALHGISLIALLLIGFAILKKPPMDQHWWMVKIAIWLFIGAAPALVKRKILPPWLGFTLCLVAGASAAWLGYTKPF